MLIPRAITPHLKSLAKQFPVVAVMGPRQSGKTTLVKETFPEYAYVSLEELDMRRAAKEDPRSFFATYEKRNGLIIDEIQEVPELLSYMQGIVDRAYRPGFFIITGSQHFLLHEKITQTLAGRIALLTLLPLSVSELQHAGIVPDAMESLIIKGFYPRVYVQPIEVKTWCASYIKTYVEKDVRQVLHIVDVLAFQHFLKLCAARVGNVINYAELARDAGVSPHTAKAWLSILQASFIITLVAPYYNNFNKRVIKSPKLYFFDPSLVCSLLSIRSQEELLTHPLRGALFETLVMSEFFKYFYNQNETPALYFWRDVQGHEIDVVVEKAYGKTVPIEIKAGRTISDDFFKGLRDWQSITKQSTSSTYVIYGGDETVQRAGGTVFSWRECAACMHVIYGD